MTAERVATPDDEEAPAELDPLRPAGRTTDDLDRFWDAYELPLRRYAWHLLDVHRIPSRTADVDDVTQSTYADLRAEWPIVLFPVAYTRSRAEAAVFAALRYEKRQGPPPESRWGPDDERGEVELPDPTAGPEPIVLDKVIDDSVMAALPEAMQTLTPKQRASVIATTSGECTRKEAAAEVGVAEGTLSPHRDRGLEKLHRHLLPLVLGVVVWLIGTAIVAVMKQVPGWLADDGWLTVATAVASVAANLLRVFKDRPKRDSNRVVSPSRARAGGRRRFRSGGRPRG